MAKASASTGMLVLALALAACNQTSAVPMVGASMVTAFDPTGISGTAVGLASSVGAQVGTGAAPAEPDFGQFAPRLRDVAAGNTARPNPMASIDSQVDGIMAMQTLGLASSVTGAAIGGAMSGGVGLIGAAPQLAMQAAMTSERSSRLAAMSSQTRASLAKAEAERAAGRIVPDEDRPAEAQAILSIADAEGRGSAAWDNPETGASGRVTIQPVNRANGPATVTCRLVQQEWKRGQVARKGSMAICRSGGE